MVLRPYSRLNRIVSRSSDQDLNFWNSNCFEYMVMSLFQVNITRMIQNKASLAKNFHVQPSEIDRMQYWEYEMFIKELSDLVEQENKQQEEQLDKYHVKDLTDPKRMDRMTATPQMPKMPSFGSMPTMKGFQ